MRGNRCTRAHFMGVFPADDLLSLQPEFPSSIIVNTERRNHPGKHWVAIYFTPQHTCEFFYSYEHSPQFYHQAWLQWIKHHSRSWTYNRKVVQPKYSAACGLHWIFFLFYRRQGMSMKSILNMYSGYPPLNDLLAKDIECHTLEDVVIDPHALIANQYSQPSMIIQICSSRQQKLIFTIFIQIKNMVMVHFLCYLFQWCPTS